MLNIRKIIKNNTRGYAMGLALVAIMIFFAILTDGMLFMPLNITNLILQNSYVFILGMGMLLCILSGGNIDLSVGSVMAVAGAAAMQLLSNDPMAFARCMLGHTGWLGRHLLRSVRMSGLDIFWTVTADEASATAELFGAEMALANNLLALVQQYIRVQSDRLWLEPDFTGERAGERIVSFRLTSCAAVLLWLVIRLLHRLWKDPQLQPAAKA